MECPKHKGYEMETNPDTGNYECRECHRQYDEDGAVVQPNPEPSPEAPKPAVEPATTATPAQPVGPEPPPPSPDSSDKP